MISKKKIRKICRAVLPLTAVLLSFDAMSEGELLDVSHRFVGSGQFLDGHTLIALELQITNTGVENLSELSLSPMPGATLLIDTHDPINIGDLAVGESVVSQWHFTVLGNVEGATSYFPYIQFTGAAKDSNNESFAFPVDSKVE